MEGTLDIRLTHEGYYGRGWPYVNGLTSAKRFFKGMLNVKLFEEANALYHRKQKGQRSP
jgi:hypothetical protein